MSRNHPSRLQGSRTPLRPRIGALVTRLFAKAVYLSGYLRAAAARARARGYRWRDRRHPDPAWKPTGIRQIYSGFDEGKATAAARRAFDRYTTAEAVRVQREDDVRAYRERHAREGGQ